MNEGVDDDVSLKEILGGDFQQVLELGLQVDVTECRLRQAGHAQDVL